MQVLDIPQSKDIENHVVSGAMALWQKFYGTPRLSGRDQRIARRDTGCPRDNARARVKPSMAAWLREQSRKIGHRARVYRFSVYGQDVVQP